MILSLAMLKFMELYDTANHATHGKFKLSHFDIGKLLECGRDIDKYGNIYYRQLTTCIRENLIQNRDYIIEPKVKNKRGQKTWLLTKESLFVLTLLLKGGKRYRVAMVCEPRLQQDQSNYLRRPFAQPTRAVRGA